MDYVATATARDRSDLFARAASALKPERSAAIIEKDFWVCWSLRRVFDVVRFRPRPIFKGGTSLSKVYNVIDRFSEDVDLSLSRADLGFTAERDPEQAGISKTVAKARLDALVVECKRVVADKLLLSLRKDFATVLGSRGWSIDLDTEDPQTIVFLYPGSGIVGGERYVRPVIRLEMGARSDDWPAEERRVRPYAAEVFPQAFMIASECTVRTLDARRTFWEKATLLHAEYHRPNDRPAKERLSRHYYDLYRLSRHEIGRAALKDTELLKRVVQHKKLFFASGWAKYETAVPGTFRLVPPAGHADRIRQDYGQMQEMLFGKAPTWDDIVAEIRRIEEMINRMKEGSGNVK